MSTNKTEVEIGERLSAKSNTDILLEAFFFNSLEKKQLINIPIGGLRYFFYLWLTSNKPKYKKESIKEDSR